MEIRWFILFKKSKSVLNKSKIFSWNSVEKNIKHETIIMYGNIPIGNKTAVRK